MTEAIGLTRLNDSPLGGNTEFRGNMQGGGVFNVDNVPVWDGEKFAPGTNDALLLAYGGLATSGSTGHLADDSLIDNWDAITPLGGVPLQTVPDLDGFIVVVQAGTYEINFNAVFGSLDNGVQYTFLLNINGVPQAFGCSVDGSNSLDTQASGFTLLADADAAFAIGVNATSPADNVFDLVNATLTVKRIG